MLVSHDMRRPIPYLMLGIFCAALFTAAISVYVFHDVDQDKIGHWNEAFSGLFAESVLFTLMVGGPVWLLTLLGSRLFRLTSYHPRATLSFLLGIGVTVLQYPWEFAAREALPKFADSSLTFYLVVAVLLCTTFLLHDSFSQRKLCEATAEQILRE